MTTHPRVWSRLPAVQDAGLAAALFLACLLVNGSDPVLALATVPTDDERITAWWIATALIVAAVALRRRWPLPTLVLCVLSVASHLAMAFPFLVIDLGVLIPMYTVATRHRRTVSFAVLACVLLLATGWSLYWAVVVRPAPGLPDMVHAVIPAPREPPVPGLPPEPGRAVLIRQSIWSFTWNGIAVLASALITSCAVGAGPRSQRAYLDGLRSRADALELERDQQAALAVAAERGRISRELHDVVAHGLSVIVIQAQGGAAALDNRPADTRVALDAIVRTGRDSLADMRRVLAAVGTAEDAWHPQPGLAQLTTLLAQVRKAGTPVRLQVDGAAAPLPSTVDLSAYRIVQESLTNTMKHAGTGAQAEVRLSYRRTEVGIEVSDDGHGVVGHRDSGNGLRGMRERAKLLGGSLVAEPGPAGGFVVRAALPIRGHDL